MTNEEILKEVKTRLGITGDYQNEVISSHIEDVIAFMTDAGVSEEVVTSRSALGAISRGVADLWNYGAGDAEFSRVFFQRVTQLAYKGAEVGA
jgi:uncharacterized protein CbrC (UPF0167 family)